MKKRLFYLDFVRAISTFIIVLTHYNAIFLFDIFGRPDLTVGGAFIGNIYIGSLGVGLFLIISGAALMHVYGNKEHIDWKKFYIKRFATIFPVFWVAYAIVFCYSFIKFGAIPPFPFQNIFLSVIGMDGYLSNFGVTAFYYVGEWFMGFIIILYLIFPLLNWAIKKCPIGLASATLVVYALSIVFFKDKAWFGISLPFNLVYFVFGMLFIKYVKKVHISVALGALLIFVANHFLKPTIANSAPLAQAFGHIQSTYISICAFLFLVWLSDYVKLAPVKRVCSTICKYSFPCFIIHHWLTREIAFKFYLPYLTNLTSNLLFITCCVAIGFASVGLYHLTEKIVAYVKHLFAKDEKKDEKSEPVSQKPEDEPVAENATEPAPTTAS